MIAVAGGGTQELRLASAGTGASAIHLNASAGGINLSVGESDSIVGGDLYASAPGAIDFLWRWTRTALWRKQLQNNQRLCWRCHKIHLIFFRLSSELSY